MSHSSKIFEEVPVKVQNKNGFDLSHLNCGTSKCGQLVPVMCKLLPPNSDFTLGINMNVELPPLATSFMGRIDAICEGFVVPCSMLYGGWKQFISNQQNTMFPATQNIVVGNGGYAIPFVSQQSVFSNDYASFRTLLGTNDNIVEYLGARYDYRAGSYSGPGDVNISLLPLLAYHLIWDVYYRNKQITKTIFAVNPNYSDDMTEFGLNKRNVSLIWHSFYFAHSSVVAYEPEFTVYAGDATIDESLTFPDGISVFSTRQRNYSRDYFTAGTPSPQQGNASKLSFSTAGATGEFTINALRAANSLQKFLETNNLSGDYADMMRNRWGTRPIDADFDEPYYLGRVVLPVYQKSVYQSVDDTSGGGTGSPNPFTANGALGARGAHGGFAGEGSICDKFHNSTWSYVMCLFSLVPHAMYSYGINKELCMLSIGDFPAPELQSIGNESIDAYEIWNTGTIAPAARDFAYIPRYSRFKYMDDEVHGELRPGRTLESFVLQRVLDYTLTTPKLNTSFLEIPQDALDDVFAVTTANMNLSCWYEIFFEFKVSMPLADFCIPTLGDIQDTHTIKSKQGGSRL